jgi:hypothetical protein
VHAHTQAGDLSPPAGRFHLGEARAKSQEIPGSGASPHQHQPFFCGVTARASIHWHLWRGGEAYG